MTYIRQSQDVDLPAILTWLKDEYDQTGTGAGFWCNRSLIQQAHVDGHLVVADDGDTDRAVAFQLGGLLHPGILEVRPDKRGMGFGRKLVEYCIARAREDDECVLHIECKPASSVPFWRHMGFCLFSDAFGERCPSNAHNHAFRILRKEHGNVPAESDEVTVQIRFYSECGVKLRQSQLSGIRLNHRQLVLQHRVVSYCPYHVFTLSDTFVDVHINGRLLYSGRAEKAKSIGVQNRNGEVYFIDKLILPLHAADIPMGRPGCGDGHES